MSEIALYNVLTKLGIEPEEAKEAVTDVASSKDMATKSDIKDMATKADIKDMAMKSDIKDIATKADIRDMATKSDLAEIKADVNALKWMMGLLLAINVAFIVSAVGLMMKFL